MDTVRHMDMAILIQRYKLIQMNMIIVASDDPRANGDTSVSGRAPVNGVNGADFGSSGRDRLQHLEWVHYRYDCTCIYTCVYTYYVYRH